MKKKILGLIAALGLSALASEAKTLVVYDSYTNNVATIVDELTKLIDADVVRIEPAEKGLDYAANGYAIGSAQIQAIRDNPTDAASYPAIDPVSVDLDDYDCVIIGAPLWWSNMASPLQTYLFENGKEMAGKHIGLIVSSSSSGISSVEADAKRLIPDGVFFPSSRWIRSAQTTNSASLLKDWLKSINYDSVTAMESLSTTRPLTVYSISGALIGRGITSTAGLVQGLYIIDGKKVLIN